MSYAMSQFLTSTEGCRIHGNYSQVIRRRQVRKVGQVPAKRLERESETHNSGWKDYIDGSKELIKSDGGPPRWFSPVHLGSRLHNSPLLLFLPGTDGMGLGLISHHQKLGKIFDMWCLHIPVKDRTPFTELVKMVERSIRCENQSFPNRPIYLIGESLGANLALAVAARNPDIDLVLILANPATSYNRSQLQRLTPLLEAMPGQLSPGVPYFLSLMADDPSRTASDYMVKRVKGLSMQNTAARELLEYLSVLSSSLPVLAEIVPMLLEPDRTGRPDRQPERRTAWLSMLDRLGSQIGLGRLKPPFEPVAGIKPRPGTDIEEPDESQNIQKKKMKAE